MEYLPYITSETPPRAWGRRYCVPFLNTPVRNTPTGVGKTAPVVGELITNEKHPHGRGEDLKGGDIIERDKETPPRAWGRQTAVRLEKDASRNTPTGVGKTKRTGGRDNC